ncbi:hypothetical protein B1R32_10635 [Abditibacterium utsteinense]|uniref:Uncharacterized protein n=1 Tax=Abditibacterium utsteinense TaxID=1960156 RepID=A0A2S8STR6_9BACT|nr:hypothetical protein [Abditibacterium utsteinense]PQV64191.1 hypothetical protein B1R32_10635 [Abditibacterium utsteinense]
MAGTYRANLTGISAAGSGLTDFLPAIPHGRWDSDQFIQHFLWLLPPNDTANPTAELRNCPGEYLAITTAISADIMRNCISINVHKEKVQEIERFAGPPNFGISCGALLSQT